MNTSTRTMRLAAAALLGLAATTAAFGPAYADEAQPKKKVQVDTVQVDTRTTGSIAAAPACDPGDPKAGIVCHVTRGKPDARFPSAPVNPAFGF